MFIVHDLDFRHFTDIGSLNTAGQVRPKSCSVLLNQRYVCEGLSQITSFFTLHLALESES